MKSLLREFRVESQPDLPPFQGGVIGYWSYDLGRHLERLPSLAEDDLALPEMYVGFYDWALAHDGDTGCSYLITTGLPDGTERRAEARATEVMARVTSTPSAALAGAPPSGTVNLRSNFTPDAYMAAVERVKAYLAAGDAYQVNLSQRFSVALPGRPVVALPAPARSQSCAIRRVPRFPRNAGVERIA